MSHFWSVNASVTLLLFLSAAVFADHNINPPADENVRFAVEFSQGSDKDTRTREVRKYFQSLGREFEVYRISPTEPTAAGKHYKLERERAGNFRYNSLKVANKTFFRYLASEVKRNFEPLPDLVHQDDSAVTGEELLQILFRNARGLSHKKADLDTVTNGVTLTYVYDDFQTIMVPTTYNFKDNTQNTDGTTLKSDYGVNSFSKHYLLASILNDEVKVSMAGKIFIAVVPLDDDSPLKLDSVFDKDGDVDLDHYRFDVTVTNDSGTFKPNGEELPLFAQLMANVLDIPELRYRAWVEPGSPPLEGVVTPE